jgi:hypothetical protein
MAARGTAGSLLRSSGRGYRGEKLLNLLKLHSSANFETNCHAAQCRRPSTSVTLSCCSG